MAKCPICGEKIGAHLGRKTADGVICARCANICDSFSTLPISTLQEYWGVNKKRWEAFAGTTKLKYLGSDHITIDETHRFFVFGDVKKLKMEPVVFGFDEVDSYETKTFGGKTVTKKKGGITRAIVGGVIAGPVGAVVGSNTSKAETKTVGEVHLTSVYFTTYAGKVSRASSNYPIGFTAFLDRCIAEAQEKADASAPSPLSVQQFSEADELLKFKQLLDVGAITQEEYDAKKKQILGL